MCSWRMRNRTNATGRIFEEEIRIEKNIPEVKVDTNVQLKRLPSKFISREKKLAVRHIL